VIHRGALLATPRRMKEWMKKDDPTSLAVKDAWETMLQRNEPGMSEADLSPSAKIRELMKILARILKEDEGKEANDRRKVIIYCEWTSLWPALCALLGQKGFFVLPIIEDGGLRRDHRVLQFQKSKAHMVGDRPSWIGLISSAVATGVNLTRGSVLIMLVCVCLAQEAFLTSIRIFHGLIKELNN
jgi:hypothetical protein